MDHGWTTALYRGHYRRCRRGIFTLESSECGCFRYFLSLIILPRVVRDRETERT